MSHPLGLGELVIEIDSRLSFPLEGWGQRCGKVSLSHSVRARVLALRYGCWWRWAWEYYHCNIDMEPPQGFHSPHASEGAENANKLGGIWIGDRLVSILPEQTCSRGTRPSCSGNRSMMVGVDVKRSSFRMMLLGLLQILTTGCFADASYVGDSCNIS